MGNHEINVRIVNTSATGFLLACQTLDAAKGDLLQLRTATGWSEVRIAHIEPYGEAWRLGVEHVRDLCSSQPTDWRYLLVCSYRYAKTACGLLLLCGLLIAFFAMVAPLLAIVWPPAKNFDPSPTLQEFAVQATRFFRPHPES